jgi:hypothetical protein
MDTFVKKLIDNLSENKFNTKHPLKIDLVLSGGAFNGGYLIGALFYLKEMEKRNFIQINRISGCSVGAIAGLYYLYDDLNNIIKIYRRIISQFKKKQNLSVIKNIKNIVGEKICSEYQKANNKLFIGYNNVNTCEKKVKSNYKNADDLCDTLIKSSFIPFLIDENVCYKRKYIDGCNPFIFEYQPNVKILFLDVLTSEKINTSINIKNEKNIFSRALSGMMEIHYFFVNNKRTEMCSYVNNWSVLNKGIFQLKMYIEKLIIYILHIFLFVFSLSKNTSSFIKDSFYFKLSVYMTRCFFNFCLENYCV